MNFESHKNITCHTFNFTHHYLKVFSMDKIHVRKTKQYTKKLQPKKSIHKYFQHFFCSAFDFERIVDKGKTAAELLPDFFNFTRGTSPFINLDITGQ